MMSTGKALLPFTFLFSAVHAFSFSHDSPTQCDLFTLNWSGGTAPFSVLITPVFDNPRSVNVPATASGSFSLRLPLNAGRQFVVAMSDATGFASGGVSELLTVGNSVSRVACDTKMPPVDFQFQLNSQLQQCAPFVINGFDVATQPVTITGLIPLGTPIQLHSNPGSSSFTWDPVNVPAGTSIIFFLTDATGRFGGSSHLTQVANSPNSACINGQSPMTTATAAFTTVISVPTRSRTRGTLSSSTSTTVPTAAESAGSHKDVSPGSIGAAVAGSFVAFLVIGSLLAFWYRRYYERRGARRFNASRRRASAPPLGDFHDPRPLQSQPAPGSWTTFASTPGSEYIAEPWMHQPNPGSSAHQPTSGSTTYQPNPWNSTSQQPTSGSAMYQDYPSPMRHPYSTSQSNLAASQSNLATSQSNLATSQSISESTTPHPTGSGTNLDSAAPFSDGTSQQFIAGSAPYPPTAANVTQRPESWSELPYREVEKRPPPTGRRTKLILHTDVEEEIELPPQYSDRREDTQPPS